MFSRFFFSFHFVSFEFSFSVRFNMVVCLGAQRSCDEVFGSLQTICVASHRRTYWYEMSIKNSNVHWIVPFRQQSSATSPTVILYDSNSNATDVLFSFTMFFFHYTHRHRLFSLCFHFKKWKATVTLPHKWNALCDELITIMPSAIKRRAQQQRWRLLRTRRRRLGENDMMRWYEFTVSTKWTSAHQTVCVNRFNYYHFSYFFHNKKLLHFRFNIFILFSLERFGVMQCSDNDNKINRK